MQDTHRQLGKIHLQRTAGPYMRVKKRRWRKVRFWRIVLKNSTV